MNESDPLKTELFVLKMSGRAAVRGGIGASVGDPKALGSNTEGFNTGIYAGADDFNKAQRKGDLTTREGVYAVAGVGYYADIKDDGELEVKGPNVGFGASGSSDGVRAMAKAEVASVSASAGRLKSTVGLAADTGLDISKTQLEAKVLGTGISFGRKMGVSLFGTGIEFELWK